MFFYLFLNFIYFLNLIPIIFLSCCYMSFLFISYEAINKFLWRSKDFYWLVYLTIYLKILLVQEIHMFYKSEHGKKKILVWYLWKKSLQKLYTNGSCLLLSQNNSCIINKSNNISNIGFYNTYPSFLLSNSCSKHFPKIFEILAEWDFIDFL